MRVELHDIHKSYGSVEVVKGLDLDVSDGEFLVLLGESGCGKSTALRMIAGLESISRGKIIIGERDVTQILPKYRDVAMVFQSYALYPHMNVAENIGYPLKLRKIGAKERARAVRETAEKVHLEDYLDRMPKQLSGGQRQRVALARAMVRRPAVFLMDEPLSNLDAKLRGAMRAELKHLQYELGVTTIYVTHDQIEAMTLAHRVAIMDGGVLQQVAPPKEVYNDPANRFVARFIGAPAMNILSGAIAGGTFRSKAGIVPLAGFEAREKVDFGFRPEDANLVPPEEGMLRGEVFSYEMTGNETIVTCRLSGEDAIVRMSKDFEIGLGDKVGISLSAEKTCLFDHDSGIRLRR